MKRLLAAAVAVAALSLAACGTATPYQPLVAGQAQSGGFTDQQIETNRWRVTFSGNSLTDRRTVETYLLFRSAELSLSQGYDWFANVDSKTDANVRYYADPTFYGNYGPGFGYWGPSWRLGYGFGPRFGWGGWGGYGGWGPGYWGQQQFDVRQVTRYEAMAEIYMGKGPKPANDRNAFDARQVVEKLRPSIILPK
jgi:predicted small lipoprotein YifL